MALDRKYPSYSACVAEILSSSKTPLSVDSLIGRIATQRPVGRGARSAVYQAISRLYQAIPVGAGHFGWLSGLLRGKYFRHSLSRYEVKRGNLLLDELEHAVFFPQFFQTHKPDTRLVTVSLMGGPTLQAHAHIEKETWALRLGTAFVEWIDQTGGGAEDDLLIQVEDAVGGEYGIRLQPKESRQEELIQKRNLFLSRAAEQIVDRDRKSRNAMPVWEMAAALVGQDVYSDEIPPDDMHFVLHEFSILKLVDDAGYTTDRKTDSAGNDASHDRKSPSNEETTPKSRQQFLTEFWDADRLDQLFHGNGHATIPQSDGARSELSSGFSDEEACEAYKEYLGEHQEFSPGTPPLNHLEYHLLEAELEMLVSLEDEFGCLMPEQERRKGELADRLFLDPDLLMGSDWDQDDPGDVPYWNN